MTPAPPPDAGRSVRAGRPSKVDSAALADHVVAVADQLFVLNGYRDTSMTAVASTARVGKQTVYSRFPDKASLFREVIRRRMERLAAMSQRPGPPLDQLKDLGAQALAMVCGESFTALNRIIIAEAITVPELAANVTEYWERTFVAQLLEAVETAQRDGLCTPGEPALLARWFIWGLIGDHLRRSLLGLQPNVSREEQRAHLERVWPLFLKAIAVR